MPVLPLITGSPTPHFRRFVGVGKGVYLLLPVIIAPIGGDERGGGGHSGFFSKGFGTCTPDLPPRDILNITTKLFRTFQIRTVIKPPRRSRGGFIQCESGKS